MLESHLEAPISGEFRNLCVESDFCYNSLWSIYNYLIVISAIQKTLLPSLQTHFGRRMWRKIEKVEIKWLDPPSIERQLSDSRTSYFPSYGMRFYAEWITLFCRTKVYSGRPYLRYQELRKTTKNANFGRASFLVFWTWRSQVTSDNTESCSYCSLMVPLRNEIAVAPSWIWNGRMRTSTSKTAENDHFST